MQNNLLKTLMIVFIICCFPPFAHASQNSEEYKLLRLKWKDALTGNGIGQVGTYQSKKITSITNEAQKNWLALVKTEPRNFLWADLASTKLSADITKSYRRIYSLALAYSTKGSSLEGNVALCADIISALDWMDKNRYVKMYNDWWDFQIGTPLALNNCIILMHDNLSEDQRNRFNNKVDKLIGSPNTDTGANRLWRAFVYAINGILKQDPLKIEIAKSSLNAIFLYTVENDGYYADGSFVQHDDHPYNMGYGIDALLMTVDLMELLNGSKWEVNDPAKSHVFKWVEDSYDPFMHNGIAMDMVRGREMARSYKEDYASGMLLIGIVAKMSKFAPAKEAMIFKSMVKQWVTSNKMINYFDFAIDAYNISLSAITLVQDIITSKTVAPQNVEPVYRQYANMDRAVKRGNGFTFGISMHSTRISNFEGDIKNENLKGWHTGDGMTYLYNADLQQFSGNFWPTVDSFRLPGTTVLANTPIKSDQRSDQSWVGGAVLGEYGVSGMEYHAFGYKLRARKSWFMFDNEIVALGAGISGADGKTVETIIENRKINTDMRNSFMLATDSIQRIPFKKNSNFSNVNYAYLEGNVKGADIGYYFPGSADIKVLRESRIENWNAVNGNPAASNTTMHTNSFLTMWFDHGTNPYGETYAYAILPGFSLSSIKKYVKKPSIHILRNDSLVQAVQEKGLGIIAANFWTNTQQSAETISCNKKASVMIQKYNGLLTISVSDPTMLNKGKITLSLNYAAKAVLTTDSRIKVLQITPTIMLEVDVEGVRGSTLTSEFKL